MSNEGPVVVTYRSPVFNASEGFVQAQATGLTRYQPLVCGRNRVGNLDPRLAGRTIVAAGPLERLRFDLTGPGPRFAQKVAAWHPVLVHAHFGPDGIAALALARRLGVPLITTLRGYDLALSRRAMMLRSLSKARYVLRGGRLRREGALFLTVCDFLREKAIAAGFPPEQTVTHYNGVDLAQFGGKQVRSPQPIVLHVGRLVDKKGTAQLLAAFATCRARHDAARLAVIGDGPLRATLARQAPQLGLAGAVDWLGARPKTEVAEWMRRAWVLAAPSVTAGDGDAEGLPNVVVEAAASGLPIVATRHAGIPEAVAHEASGLLVAEDDVPGLAAALDRMLCAPDLRAAFGCEGRRIAAARFDYRRQMEVLQDHYDRVLETRRGGGRAAHC